MACATGTSTGVMTIRIAVDSMNMPRIKSRTLTTIINVMALGMAAAMSVSTFPSLQIVST